MQCPICGGALAEGRSIEVCASCHKALSGGATVRATGEFIVPSPAALAAAEAGDPMPPPANTCAWCGKGEAEVKKLLGRSGVALCNECVALCVDILDAEVPGWK